MSESDKHQIAVIYTSGYTKREVAKMLGIGISSVHKYLAKLGTPIRPPGSRKLIKPEDQQTVLNLYALKENCPAIARKFGTNKTTVRKFLKSRGVIIRDQSECQTKHQLDHGFFHEINNARKAYWFGMFTADGCSAGKSFINLSLKMEDKAAIYQFHQDIGSTHKVREDVGENPPMCCLSFRSQRMVKDLDVYGIRAHKASTIRWPNLSPVLYQHYLRGLIDGDGTFYVSKASNQLGLGIICNWDFAVDCQKFLMGHFGFGKTEIEKSKTTDQFNVRYSGNHQLFPLVNYIYQDTGLYLARKRDIVLFHYRKMPKYRDLLEFGPKLAK